MSFVERFVDLYFDWLEELWLTLTDRMHSDDDSAIRYNGIKFWNTG
jgi:hypothetical protein